MKSKTIILSALENNINGGRAILTIYLEDELLKCKLRLYNVGKLSSFFKLAIYHENQVYSANLIEKSGVYESSFVGDFNIDNDFYAALIDTEKANKILLAGGTYQGFYFNDYSAFEQTGDVETAEEMNKNKEECENCDKCVKCKYKEYFYSQEHKQVVEQKETKEVENIVKVEDNIVPQLDEIFKIYKEDVELSSLVLNSKFVKIGDGKEEYSIGAIYNDDKLKYICYAIKLKYNQSPPEEIGKHYQWLPIDKEDPLSDGYYLVFQDANDLKILEF